MAAIVLSIMTIFNSTIYRKRLFYNFQIVFLPFEDISLNWFLNFVYQTSLAFIAGGFIYAYMSSAFLLMDHTCWGLDNMIFLVKKLQSEVQKTADDCKDESSVHINTVNAQLKTIVVESLRCINWWNKLQTQLELIFLMEFSVLSFFLCMFLFSMSSNPSSSVDSYLGIVLFLAQLFVYCWMGERVNVRIEKLVAEIYEIKWYLKKTSQRKDVLLLLVLAQNMKGFNGIFDEVNMETFKKVRKNVFTRFSKKAFFQVVEFTYKLFTVFRSIKK